MKALTDPQSTSYQFVAMKDHGGLQKASPSIISVCLETEKRFQWMLKTSSGKLPQGYGVSGEISMAVRNNSAHMKLFEELHTHQFETVVEHNHIHNLEDGIVLLLQS